MGELRDTTQLEGLEKIPTGIEGFDQITEGGLPCGRISLVGGGPGSGKTVFALQTLVNGARSRGEPGLFVAIEENARQLIANAAAFDWDIAALVDQSLYIFDARMSPDTVVVGDIDLTALLAVLGAKAERVGARWIVFDALDVLLSLLNDPAAERRELYRLRDWVLETGLTVILTAKVDEDDPQSLQRFSFLQFLVDCVILLGHDLEDHVSLRTLRVLKYRGSGYSANEFPFTVDASGIEVAGPLETELDRAPGLGRKIAWERVSTGVERLDTMLGGGYYRATSVLISGHPGTVKSTLAGAFVDAACRRGERALYVSFDEAAGEIVRNLASVDIHLAPHVQSGLLKIHSSRTETQSAEEHLLAMRGLIRAHAPRCLVIDPLSAMIRVGGSRKARSVAQRMMLLAKESGITLVCTSLMENPESPMEAAQIPISTLADTWIHLSYVVQGGERNRALTIVKARGTRHSNQVRELILSDRGATLTDVYTSGGAVLMGTARWEKEREERNRRERIRIEVEQKRRELALAELEVRSRIDTLNRELEARRAELEMLLLGQEAREADERALQHDLGQLRGADLSNGSN